MTSRYRLRRLAGVLLTLIVATIVITTQPQLYESVAPVSSTNTTSSPALDELAKLPVKGRAPKTGYARTQFGDGWAAVKGCDMREIILHRDLAQPAVGENCNILQGVLSDPYTGKIINFQRGAGTSQLVQIDHVVALGNAWQTGAQQLSLAQREALANDPLELLAVDGAANQQKSDGDAATWLPPNKSFRCQYVARQIAVKKQYSLWVTVAEKEAIVRVLSTCPGQTLPV